MITSSNGNNFRVTGPLCGEFTGPGEFPTQRPVTRSIDVFFDLPLNKRLSKHPWGWWFETPSWSLWRHCNYPRETKKIASVQDELMATKTQSGIILTNDALDIGNLNLASANSTIPLEWRHNVLDCVSNHQPHDCLLNRLFRRRSKKTSKLRVTGLCGGIPRTNGQ